MPDARGKPADKGKVERSAHLEWFRLGDLQPSQVAQRNKLNTGRVDYLVAHLDLEQIGNPTVNKRNGSVWIIDGWHRTKALLAWGFGEDDLIECWTYEGLTDEQEAERFLVLNDTLRVDPYSKFRVAVNAGRKREVNINNILGSLGLQVGTSSKDDSHVHAPGTLLRVYDRHGAVVLARTLAMIQNAYGNSGLEAEVIDGLALVIARYDQLLDDQKTADKLGGMRGGVKGLTGKAVQIRYLTGSPMVQCVAAAAVEVINSGKTGRKLTSWWKAVAQDRMNDQNVRTTKVERAVRAKEELDQVSQSA